MRAVALHLLCWAGLSGPALGRLVLLQERLASLDAEEAPTPIQRVVGLLEEMKEQLSSEAARDREAYDKMVCWCDTNNKEKTQAIADAEAKIDQLQAEVEERAARGAQLSVDIAALKTTVAERKQALSTATALREKEQAEFMAEETESVEAITMLRNAIIVLKKHNEGFLQASAAVQQSLGASLRWVALKHEELEMEAGQPKTSLRQGSPAGARLRTTGAALLAMKTDDLAREALKGGSTIDLPVKFAARILASAASGKSVAPASLAQETVVQPVAVESYSSQSGQVYGILQQMQEDFEASLSTAQKEETQARAAFTELKAALEKEISSTEEKLDEMEEDFGANTKALSDAKEDLQATRDQRSADVKFLSDLRLECQDLDSQWQTRSASRSKEITAVAETIAMLTADDARTTFHKKMGTGSPASFLQLASTSKVQRSRAIATLLRAANSLPESVKAWRASEPTPHAQLSALAVQVQLDTFVKVKQAIDDMVAQLKAKTEHEVGEKAFCVDGLNVNEKATYSTSLELRDLQNAIEALEATIEKLIAEIAFNKKTIAETEVELKAAGSVRKEENQNFKEEVLDQQAIQKILAKAVGRLQAALLQQPAVSPVKFQPYHKNAGSSPVIGLMEQIVEDSRQLEQQAQAAEQSSQTAYAEFVANTDSSIKALNNGIETKSKIKAAAASEKADKEAELGDTQDRMEGLQASKQDLHQQCDFLLKNFDVRAKARLQEIEALGAAKAFLSGMATGEVV